MKEHTVNLITKKEFDTYIKNLNYQKENAKNTYFTHNKIETTRLVNGIPSRK